MHRPTVDVGAFGPTRNTDFTPEAIGLTPEEFAAWRVTHPPMMGAETPDATAAQPDAAGDGGEGRGDVDHLAGLYDLSSAPEALQPLMQEELRKINSGIGRKFQEHADQRARWEPFEQIEGLADVPPEDVADLVAVRDMIARAAAEQDPDDEALYEWWGKLGEHFGFFGEDGQPAAAAEAAPEEQDMPAWAQQLQQSVQAITERLDGHDQNTRVNSAQAEIDRELTELADKHSLDEDAQGTVLQLALAYGGAPDALTRGLADYHKITGRAESGLLEGADPSRRPGPSTPPGGQPAGEELKLSFGDPKLKTAAMARLQGANAGAAG